MPRKRDRVFDIEKDGQYITAEFQLPSGEWVMAGYKVVVWYRAPASERDWIDKAINSPPQTIYGRSPAAKPGPAQ